MYIESRETQKKNIYARAAKLQHKCIYAKLFMHVLHMCVYHYYPCNIACKKCTKNSKIKEKEVERRKQKETKVETT